MRYVDFVRAAPCHNMDPKIFDATTAEDGAAGLDVCRGCGLWSDCEKFIAPEESWYDGVAAGAVWKHGRIVAMLRARAERDNNATI